MNIIDVINEFSENDLISITKAKFLGDYVIELIFNDSKKNVVNFGPFLMNSNHPQIRKYLDKEKFNSFAIVDGNIN